MRKQNTTANDGKDEEMYGKRKKNEMEKHKLAYPVAAAAAAQLLLTAKRPKF